MTLRLKPWQVATAVVVLSIGIIAALRAYRASHDFTDQLLFDCLPDDSATVRLFLNMADLRSSGILGVLKSSTVAQDPEYKSFVGDSGFDYMTDMDAVAANFAHGDVYMTIRGRFQWTKLSAYAKKQGGSCINTICAMPATQPNRFISFFPLRNDVLALAVSKDERGVVSINLPRPGVSHPIPSGTAWIASPGAMFKDLAWTPAGAQFLTSSLEKSQETLFRIAAEPPGASLRMEATFPTPVAASETADTFKQTTELLGKMLNRDRIKANPSDLSGLLVAGTFTNEGTLVRGIWPLDRKFLQSFLGGQIP